MHGYDAQDIALRWDAGDAGCGHLAAGTARAMSTLVEGQLLQLVTRDAGAPVDIPAWCRLTGHSLVSASHPNYIICKKGDSNV